MAEGFENLFCVSQRTEEEAFLRKIVWEAKESHCRTTEATTTARRWGSNRAEGAKRNDREAGSTNSYPNLVRKKVHSSRQTLDEVKDKSTSTRLILHCFLLHLETVQEEDFILKNKYGKSQNVFVSDTLICAINRSTFVSRSCA